MKKSWQRYDWARERIDQDVLHLWQGLSTLEYLVQSETGFIDQPETAFEYDGLRIVRKSVGTLAIRNRLRFVADEQDPLISWPVLNVADEASPYAYEQFRFTKHGASHRIVGEGASRPDTSDRALRLFIKQVDRLVEELQQDTPRYVELIPVDSYRSHED